MCDYSNIPLTQPATCSERMLVPASLPVLCCCHKVPEPERLVKRGSLSSQLWMAKHFLKPWNSLNIPIYADLRCVFGFSFHFAFDPLVLAGGGGGLASNENMFISHRNKQTTC